MDFKDKHIMVVDDDEDDRKLFCRALNQVSQDIGCLRASNGKDALEYLGDAKNSVPEIIFLDINMPVMTGWEFLTKVKKDGRMKSIPIIIFSTSSNQRDINIAYDLGAASYCVKPDEPDDLKKMLHMVVEHIDHNFKSFLSSDPASIYFHTPTI
ncbi:MAG: rcp1 3 [Bacteroidetes bacterium]|nr:rcp1 3 [Bacteroidota bacterium]